MLQWVSVLQEVGGAHEEVTTEIKGTFRGMYIGILRTESPNGPYLRAQKGRRRLMRTPHGCLERQTIRYVIHDTITT